MSRIPFLIILITCIGCVKTSEPTTQLAPLQELLKEDQIFLDGEYPNRMAGYTKLPDMTEAAFARRADHAKGIISKAEAIPLDELGASERISVAVLKYVKQHEVARYGFKAYQNSLLADAGFHIGLSFIPRSYPFKQIEDYENYLILLSDFPRFMQENIELLQAGLLTGNSQSKVIFDGYEVTFDQHIVENPEASLFYEPFLTLPNSIPASEQDNLKAKARDVVENHVIGSYQALSDFMKSDYMINTRESTGALNLPDGAAFYQHLITYYTTLPLNADSVHRLGLQEVARIRKEMDAIISRVGFEGDFASFLNFLRTDDQFYPKTSEELLKTAAYYAKEMDGQLPKLFGKLPRQPYTVNPVPDHLAPKYTGGRYVGADINSTNPGQYWVNTYNLKSRTLYTLEALTFHEAVPGHHLQNALTAEIEGIPAFRQNLYISAFGEGWGLYSEYLGKEVGFYEDPYSDFGRLTYEMWRACRLVVDTGIHAYGWSREKAMDYMASNTALSLHEVTTEVDRYISWPGQALSYKIGELKIKALRKEAEDQLGDQFNIRDFHDLVLSQGTVTLPILEEMVQQYIKDQQNSNS